MCPSLRCLRLPVLRGMLCGREEQPGNSSHHKGFCPFKKARNLIGPISIHPYIVDSIRWGRQSLSKRTHMITNIIALPQYFASGQYWSAITGRMRDTGLE